MADQKLRELTEIVAPVSTDLLYTVHDPNGTPVDRKMELGTLLGADGVWVNLVKNSPGQIVTDGAEPQWWDDSGSGTITDEDTAGEGIADKTERVFKVVTTGDDHYGYQTFTFADESLLDAGSTVVSASCWVWCDAANTASIGIYGANLGLQESAQHTGDSTWQLLTVENQTLDAADASIQFRLIVDNDTAYFTMPMLNVGSKVLPWKPRNQEFKTITVATQFDLNTTGDVAWSDTDCTANTDPLATALSVWLYISEPDGTAGSYFDVGTSTALVAADNPFVSTKVHVVGISNATFLSHLPCDDSQVIRYAVGEADADSDVRARLIINGYWRWAP